MHRIARDETLDSPVLMVLSCLSTYVLRIRCCNDILSFRRASVKVLRIAAPSRAEIWLNIRIRVIEGVSLAILAQQDHPKMEN